MKGVVASAASLGLTWVGSYRKSESQSQSLGLVSHTTRSSSYEAANSLRTDLEVRGGFVSGSGAVRCQSLVHRDGGTAKACRFPG